MEKENFEYKKNFGVSIVKNAALIAQPVKEFKTSYGVVDWWRFGINNLFPNEIAYLNRTSPAHGGILQSMKDFCGGADISEQNITDNFLKVLYENANNENKSLWHLSKEFFGSFFEIGNVFIEIVTNKKRNFLNLFVRDFTTCRLGRRNWDGFVLLYPDWERHKTDSDYVKIPLYPNFTEIDGQLHSMIHVKREVAGFPQYGLPRWLSALDSVEIGKGVTTWNKMRVATGFSCDGVLEAEFNTADEANEFEKKYNEKKAGAENAGKMIFLKKAVGGTSPATVTPFTRTSEGEFLQLRNMSIDDLVMAHGWFRSLCSLPDNTGFETQRIFNEYDVAKSVIILPMQNLFNSLIEKVLFEMFSIDVTGQIQFINKPPVKNKEVWKIWELRRDEGLDFDEKDPAQNEFVQYSRSKTTTR